MKIIIHSDGGARGNPGPAALGCVLEMGNGKCEKISKYIGTATNNQAEYQAVIEALKWVKENITAPNLEIDFLIDSKLVVEQLSGNYKLKNEGLKPLFLEAKNLESEIGDKITYAHIPREENVEADRLVNKALDERMKNVF